MRFGFHFGIREVQCGIVGSLLLVTHDFAGMQFDHALAHGVDDFLIMRGHDDGSAGAVDGIQHFHNAQRCGRIKVSGRLVGQQDLRMVHIRSRDGHALRLTAGKLMRIAVFLAGKPNRLQYFRHQRFDGGTACADHFKCERHILPHRFVVQQLVILEDEADRTTIMRHLPCGQASQIVACDADLAVRGLLFTQQQAQQCGFAGTRCAHEEHEIPSIDVEVDVIQRRPGTFRIHLAHMFKRNQRHRRTPPLCAVLITVIAAFRLPLLPPPHDAVHDASGYQLR